MIDLDIDQALPGDQETILSVLKLSLGEGSSPKTMEVWNWKHVSNPFGSSSVLLGKFGGETAGVRTMMSWQWQNESKCLNAFRAVDTAVLPNFQGKGIFSALTKAMLEQLSDVLPENLFIFNTPNEKSLPGYLKMGWKSYGRLPVVLIPTFCFSTKRILKRNLQMMDRKAFLSSEVNINSICLHHNKNCEEGKGLFTPKSYQYLKWRYLDCPFLTYWIFSDDNFFVAGYPKKRGRFIELRISELLAVNTDKAANEKLKSVIGSWVLHSKASFLSMSPSSKVNFHIPGLTLKVGPVMTINPMQMKSKLLFAPWQYQLGDLELF